jgi:thiamine-monophosphate kinase
MHEFAVLARIFKENPRLPRRVLLPPGDDMALLALGGAQRLLVAADSVIEGRHVAMGTDPLAIGRKVVLRNISDVAAMANARPLACVATAVLPSAATDDAAWRLYEGMRSTAEAWDAPLVGGDVATSADARGITASVTILAVPLDESRPVATRADAKAGDGVYVTGEIGGAWDARTGLGRHLDFTPRLAVAQELFRSLGPRLGAMIDVSDGLGRDLGHIAAMSAVAIEIDLARVRARGDALAAIGHGEDYELAFTARGEVPALVAGVAVTRIGTVLPVVGAGAGAVHALAEGRRVDISRAGFENDGGGTA